VTDGRTDGRRDRQTELRWLRRAESIAVFARKNAILVRVNNSVVDCFEIRNIRADAATFRNSKRQTVE